MKKFPLKKLNKSKEPSIQKTEIDERPKGLTLWDHIKQIRCYKDPNYFSTLSDLDLKSFNHYMILQALSMNPECLEMVAEIYKYFDIIPSPQFYTLLIQVIPQESPRKFYPWIKSSKQKYPIELLNVMLRKFELSQREIIDYLDILNSTNNNQYIIRICEDYGLSDREIQKIMKEFEKQL